MCDTIGAVIYIPEGCQHDDERRIYAFCFFSSRDCDFPSSFLQIENIGNSSPQSIMGQVQPNRTQRRDVPPIVVTQGGKVVAYPQNLEENSLIGKGLTKQYGSLEEFQNEVDKFLQLKLGRNVNDWCTGYRLAFDLMTRKFFFSNAMIRESTDESQMTYTHKDHPLYIDITPLTTDMINKSGQWIEINEFFRLMLVEYKQNNGRIDRRKVHQLLYRFARKRYDALTIQSQKTNPSLWAKEYLIKQKKK